MKRRIHDAKWRCRCIKHRKAGVMLGRKHHIPDTGKMSETCPVQWVKPIRVERFWKVGKKAVCIFRRCPYQRVADDDTKLTVNAPVNEKSKTLRPKHHKYI